MKKKKEEEKKVEKKEERKYRDGGYVAMLGDMR